MINGGPKIVAAAKVDSAEQAGRIRAELAKQTYREIQLLVVCRDSQRGRDVLPERIVGDDPSGFCSIPDFAAHVETSEAAYVLFLPDEAELKPAAIKELLRDLLQEQVVKQERVIAKLQHQIERTRAAACRKEAHVAGH